mgnify:CR=1 FL=1
MKSSWAETKQTSKYHFNNFKNDSQQDKVDILGQFIYDFNDDIMIIFSIFYFLQLRHHISVKHEQADFVKLYQMPAQDYHICP